MTYPKFVFIIPYRDREHHYIFFTRYIKYIMEDYILNKDYVLCFVHQNDDRPFNRGALKNIGFIYYKKKYPDSYKNIQFIFHDIDTIPYTKEVWNYETKKGYVKHFYGYKYALGGILTIYGDDFEKTNGFPCFWSWGFEDNIFQKRVLKNKLKIDRSQFYIINSKEVLQFFDGYKRKMSIESIDRANNYTHLDGLLSLHNLKYEYDEENYMIQVYDFDTYLNYKNEHFVDYNINNGSKIKKQLLIHNYNKSNTIKYIDHKELMFTKPSNLNNLNNSNNENKKI